MFNKIPPNDYNSRLNNSIVRYRDHPVNLTLVDSRVFQLDPIHADSKFARLQISPDDPELDISTPPLGWINFRHPDYDASIYIERTTVRKWRQGLCQSNTCCYRLSGSSISRVGSTQHFLYSKGYEDLVLNRYQSFEVSLKKLLSGPKCHSIALSKNIALSKKDKIITVFYKLEEVGWFSADERIVKVPKEPHSWIISKYLSELPWVVE